MSRYFRYLAISILALGIFWNAQASLHGSCDSFFINETSETSGTVDSLSSEQLLQLFDKFEARKNIFTWRGVELEGYVPLFPYDQDYLKSVQMQFAALTENTANFIQTFSPELKVFHNSALVAVAYDPNNLSKFEFKRDGSLPDIPDYVDIELASPILKSKEIQEDYFDILEHFLGSSGFITNSKNAGLHVHVNFENAQLAEVALVMMIWSQIEDDIAQWFEVDAQRKEHFAAPLKKIRLLRLFEQIMQGETGLSVLTESSVHKEKNQSLNVNNLRPLGKKGTLEFRIFNATTRPELIRAAIQLTTALVDAVRSKDPRLIEHLESNPIEYFGLFDLIEILDLQEVDMGLFGPQK